MVIKRLLLILAPAAMLLAGVAVKPPGAVRPWDVQDAAGPDREAVAAAAFNYERLNPLGRWLVLSYSAGSTGEWPEQSAMDCGPARWVTARTLFGTAVARGLVHCTGKQVIWA